MEGFCLENQKKNPRETAPFLAKLFYTWTFPIFAKGNRRDLKENDLYQPLEDHRSHRLGDKLEDAWVRQIKSNKRSLLRALWDVFKVEICGYILMNFLLVFTPRLCQPLLIMQILNYYIPGQSSISDQQAQFYLITIIILIFIGSISGHTYVMGMQQLGIKLRVAICSVLYRKTLRLSKYAMNQTSTGQIITLLSNDVRMFDYVMLEFCLLFVAPSELIADTVLLYFLLGKTAIYGIGFLVLFIPLQIYNGKLSANYRHKIAKKTDERILLMSEIIGGIQVIKMYAWEIPFGKLVELARRLEVKQIRTSAFVNSFMQSYNMFMSRTAQFISILGFVLSGHTPVAQYVFVITSFYNNLAKALSVNFPDAIATFANCKVSCKRLETFLNLDEVQSSIKTATTSNNPIGETTKTILKITNAFADWNRKETEETTLSNINLEIKSMDKIAIIGQVGSGKSSVINMILKELPILQGDMRLEGTISYASQEPWLFKGSIRQNILFGLKMEPLRYAEVITACALQKDFDMFPFSDLSIVGEKGVMLSGGQKARINLARSVYRRADIYLLDDPLSAVDTHVGKQLFEQCITGFLSKKCVILVTHQLQYLGAMDKVLIMENGTFTRTGTYQELQTNRSDIFVRLLSNASETGDEHQVVDIVQEKSKQVTLKSGENGPKDVQEHISTGAMSRSVYKNYFRAGGRWYIYVPVITLFVLTQICASTADYFITFWVNLEQYRAKSNNSNADANSVNERAPLAFDFYLSIFHRDLCIYIYSSLIFVLVVIAITRSISFFQYCLSASTNLHNNMFTKIARAPMRFFHTNPSGRILNRFAKDIGSIDELLPILLLDTIEIGISVVAVSIILTSINPWMVVPTIAILLLFYTYKYYYIKTSRSIKRLEGKVRSPIFSHMTASLQGLATVRAFNIEAVLTEEFDRHQDLHSATYYMFLACNRAFGLLLDMNCIVYVAIVTVSTFFTASFGGNVGLSITQAMGLTGRMQWGVRQWSEMENQMTSVERVLEYSNIEPERDIGKKPSKIWPNQGSIEFKAVTMRYAPKEPAILKNLSFRVKPREKVGIVGRTGAGKSSIVSAIFRLSPVEGEISIDEIDTSKITLHDLRSKISIIPQEPFLFSGSLRKNLDPFDEFTDDTLWGALEEVELKNFIQECPSGLSHEISEGGSNFSVGQRQLVCLARAVIRKNKILIMDEATANVDPFTDQLIQNTIRKNFEDCTVLTIAHRLHTIMDSDKVLVMDAGCIVEFAHAFELLEARGVFHSLVMETGKSTSNNLKNLAENNYRKLHSSEPNG